MPEWETSAQEIEAEVQRVLDVVRTVFPVEPIPKAEVEWESEHSSDAERMRAFQTELTGKRWTELSAEFVRDHMYYFHHLTPGAHAYYLPAILMDGLAACRGEDRSPSSSATALGRYMVAGFTRSSVRLVLCVTVGALSPSDPALCARGEDRGLQYLQSALTEAQYRAICSFLGFVFSLRRRRYSYDAAQALRWGWNGIETPELEAVTAYASELHSYVWPEPEDPDRATLFHEITDAFADTPYPGDRKLGSDCRDPETAEWVVELRGVRWQSAHPDLLSHCYTALSFLSAAGFRYFLPAYLRADLVGYDGIARPVFHLIHGMYDRALDCYGDKAVAGGVDIYAQKERRRMVRRFKAFNRSERLAIIHYLEYQCVRDEYDRPRIDEALARYWRPSLERADA